MAHKQSKRSLVKKKMSPKDMNEIVLIGGGLSAMMCAFSIKKRFPNYKVIIVENSNSIGGKYNSFIYDNNCYFDQGMHVIYETCNPEIDSIYFEIMDETKWNVFEKNRKDVAGLFFNGHLQKYSHYIDLRNFDKAEFNQCISSVFSTLGCDINDETAEKLLRSHFGDFIYEKIHSKVLKNMYGISGDKLSSLAIKLTALERIIVFDEDIMVDLMNSSYIRSKIAFPNQLALPDVRENDQKALYPKKYGMIHFVKEFERKLESLGVTILKGVSVKSINMENKTASSITITCKKQTNKNLELNNLIWTAGLPSLATGLGINFDDLTHEPGPRMIYVNFIFDKPLNSGELYYFYCYDHGFATHRVTNYSEYCPDEKNNGIYRCCVELWPSKIGLMSEDLTESKLIKLALKELTFFSAIDSDHIVKFVRVETAVGRFPLPSKVNESSLNKLRSRIEEKNITNLINIGVLSERQLFFLPEVLRDAFTKINAKLGIYQ